MYVKNERFNFGLYFICQLVSNLGSSMQVSIIPLVILDMTGSGSTMGFFFSAILFTAILSSLYSGSFADRKNQKNILVTTDIINGIVILIYLFNKNNTVTTLFLMLFTQTIVSSFFGSANNAIFSKISPTLNIGKRTSFMSIGNNFVGILSPIIGVFLYTLWGLNFILILNMLSFLISGILEYFLKVDIGNSSEKKDMTNYKTVINYLKKEIVLKDILFLTLVLNFLLTPFFGVVLIYFIKEQIKMPDQFIGYLQSLTMCGLFLGSIIVFRFSERFKLKEKYLLMIPVQSIALFLFYFTLKQSYSLSHKAGVIVFIIGILTLFIINSMILIPTNSMLHEKVDNNIKGKFFALFMGTKQILIPLGIAVFGVIIEKVDIVFLVGILILITLSFQFYFMVRKQLYQRYLEFLAIKKED